MVSFISLAQAVGLPGVFASRVFLPVFAAALIMRYGPSMEVIEQLGLLGDIDPMAAPTWFTHDVTLTVLGVLAALEFLAHKSPDARMLLNEVDQYAKPVAAGLTLVGVSSVADLQFVDDVMAQAGVGIYFIAAIVTGGTFIVASAHNALMRTFIEIDEGDDSGLLKLFSWVQDLWSTFGVFLLVLFPIVMVILILIVMGFIFLLRKRAEIKEERSKIACPTCSQPMYRCAIACPNCKAANASPTRLNWLGVSTPLPTHNREQHPLQLMVFRRCRTCGTRLRKRTPHQACPTCQALPFDDMQRLTTYDQLVSDRLPQVLVLTAILSTIPIVGLIPGVIYYRMALVAPYRRYLGRGRAMLLRWFVRIVGFFLIIIQIIPGLGIITVPALAWLSFAVYRRAFIGQATSPRKQIAPTPAPAVAGA